MSITPGSPIVASDFVSTPSQASDSGKGIKLNASGRIPAGFPTAGFGGTGADGALAISLGTTNIDCGGAKVLIKNYTSISITGTGKLTFSNPHSEGTMILLRSIGDVNLTSSQAPMIDASGMGAAGGVGFIMTGNNGPNQQAIGGSDSAMAFFIAKGSSTAGTGGAAYQDIKTTISSSNKWWEVQALIKYFFAWCGGGGGGAGARSDYPPTTNGQAGSGGNGGGCLIIECGGAWNFTTTNGISVKGANGTHGSQVSDGDDEDVGGGGGGGGGFFYALYNSLTANTGTVIVSGGTGGNVFSNATCEAAYSAGGGASLYNAGSNSGDAGNGAQGGGNGGAGLAIIEQNIMSV